MIPNYDGDDDYDYDDVYDVDGDGGGVGIVWRWLACLDTSCEVLSATASCLPNILETSGITTVLDMSRGLEG